jgi:hypothetical protein
MLLLAQRSIHAIKHMLNQYRDVILFIIYGWYIFIRIDTRNGTNHPSWVTPAEHTNACSQLHIYGMHECIYIVEQWYCMKANMTGQHIRQKVYIYGCPRSHTQTVNRLDLPRTMMSVAETRLHIIVILIIKLNRIYDITYIYIMFI